MNCPFLRRLRELLYDPSVLRCPLVLAVLAVSHLMCASNSPDAQETLRRIEQSVSRTNILDLSFQMKANVQILSQGKRLDGHYQLSWNGTDQWREEITFLGYSELHVGVKGKVWRQRSTDFLPLRIWDLHAAIGLGSGGWNGPGESFTQLGLTPKDKIRRVHSRKEDGEKLTCVEVEDETKVSFDICTDDATGTLVRGSSYKDRDFQPVGGKLFPRFLSFVEGGNEVASVKVIELIAPSQFSPDTFNPPPGVAPLTGCLNPAPLRYSHRVAPEYPHTARERHIQGAVAVHAWIGADGIPRIGQVVEHANPDLENSTLDTIRQWRYQPATCNNNPVDVETVHRVVYQLSP
jgi:TonB family protein